MKIEGNTGHIAVGRYLLQLDDCGAQLREASRAERAHIRPRPTPVLLRPRLIRGLAGRRLELAAALSAIDAGLPVEVSGESGIGKTAFLRHLAHNPRAASFVDGVAYIAARHQSFIDLQQLIFDAFHESDERCKPTQTEIRRGLQEKQALIILDDARLIQDELEQVIDIAPRSAFAIATRDRCLWGEVRSIALTGLPAEDAVTLLQREIERSLEDAEQPAAETLCSVLDGHPLRILQAAAVIRERGMSLGQWTASLTPEAIVTELLESIDEKQRRIVLALTALSGISVQAQHIAGIAEVTDAEPSLATLAHRGLVLCTQSRYQLADGVTDRLRRMEDLKPWVNRAITYFISWAERSRRNPDILLDESEALLRAQQQAIDTRRWGEVLMLGRLLETSQVIHARWGAWAINLERCLAAAKGTGDRSAEAWALHQMGTRAVCLGETGNARALLKRAAHLREAHDEEAALTVTEQNLAFVEPPAPKPPVPERPVPEPVTPERPPVADSLSRTRPAHESPEAPPAVTRPPELVLTPAPVALDLASLPLREEAQPPVYSENTNHYGGLALIVLLFAVAGGLAFSRLPQELVLSSGAAKIDAFFQDTFKAMTRARPPGAVSRPEVDSPAQRVVEPDAVPTSAGTKSRSMPRPPRRPFASSVPGPAPSREAARRVSATRSTAPCARVLNRMLARYRRRAR